MTLLSGGQQRRLSLGCSIIHSPLLLILDEPTVGTDPLLRLDIWSALRSLARQGTTGNLVKYFYIFFLPFLVLLTTHYIEEAVSADIVAFLRGGRILEEGEPEGLLKRFSCNSLETLFYQFCYEDEKKHLSELAETDGQCLLDDQVAEGESQRQTASPVENPQKKDLQILSDFNNVVNRKVNLSTQTKALLLKNLMVLRDEVF